MYFTGSLSATAKVFTREVSESSGGENQRPARLLPQQSAAHGVTIVTHSFRRVA
jgi:hypothetical protein